MAHGVWIFELITWFHPTADSLCIEVGVKKAAPRTVVTRLVNGVPMDQMQNQMVNYSVTQNLQRCGGDVLLGEVEILAPPMGLSSLGLMAFDSFPGEPDEMMNPNKILS